MVMLVQTVINSFLTLPSRLLDSKQLKFNHIQSQGFIEYKCMSELHVDYYHIMAPINDNKLLILSL